MPRARLHRSVKAEAAVITELRHEVVAYAEQLGADPGTSQSVALAVGEALNNVVMHAYVDSDTGPVHIQAWEDPRGRLVVDIADEGIGMVPRPDSPGLGLGLPLMAQMADDVHVATRQEGPGTMVSLRFTLSGRAAA